MGGLTEKLLAGWELGKTRVLFLLPTWQKGHFMVMGTLSVFAGTLPCYHLGGDYNQAVKSKTWNKTEPCVEHPWTLESSKQKAKSITTSTESP